MAKPKHVRERYNDIVFAPPHPPSNALLSILAFIATIPPAVAGAALPPPHPPAFLCPSIERDHVLIALPSPSTSRPCSISVRTSKCDAVADRYIQGPDNLWRRMNDWTLYGSTCYSSFAADTSAVQPQSSTFHPTPHIPFPSSNFDTSVLPAGWENTASAKSSTESTIILALAIILAGLICLLMIGCVIWRRRKKKARDIERKPGHKPGVRHGSKGNPNENTKLRMWANATARWKSNVRHAARRRRKRHGVSSAVDRPLSPTLSDSHQLFLTAPSASSRPGSFASEEPTSGPEADPCQIELPGVPHVSSHPASPPAYGASFVSSFSRPSPGITVLDSEPASGDGDGDSARSRNHPYLAEDKPPYTPPKDGHVATDDKSQLAHLQELASSPPMVPDAASASTFQSVSAPEWHEVEDDLEDSATDLPTSCLHLHFSPSFPPPPSKADIPSLFGYLDDDPLRYGDDTPSTSGSPRPSLGTFPSAPPMDDPGLEPSAPSLESEDDLFQDWDGASSYAPDVRSAADLGSTSASAIEPPISPTSSSASRASFPPIPESPGMLPRYQP